MAHSRLLTLPTELQIKILDRVGVETILALALVCSNLFRLLKPRLERNKKYHTKYRQQNDLEPRTVSVLLREAFNDPDTLWHVRVFDFWGPRPDFERGKPFEDRYDRRGFRNDAHLAGQHVQNVHSLPQDYFTSWQWGRFRTFMINHYCMSAADADQWMYQIGEGCHEPLNGLLYALCSRMRRLNYIADNTYEKHPLQFLKNAIESLYQARRPSEGESQPSASNVLWPLGLQSLRVISLCKSPNSRHPYEAFYCPPSVAAVLFKLPNIQTLNLTMVGWEDDPNPDFELVPKSSTVEQLNLYSCGVTDHAWLKYIRAPVRLRAFATDHSSPFRHNTRWACQALSDVQGEELQWLAMGRWKFEEMVSWFEALFPRLRRQENLESRKMVRYVAEDCELDLSDLDL